MDQINSLQSEISNGVKDNLLELNLSKKTLILIYALIGIFFLIPNLIIIFWSIGNDDSVYMGAIRMVLEGKLPYRDFCWFHTPGFLYINALVAYFLKLDLIPLRSFAFVFGLSGFIMMGIISYRLSGQLGCLIALTISATNFHYAASYSDIYFVSMANFFLILAISLQISLKDSYCKIFFITGALIASFSIRSTNGICIPVYGLFLLLTTDNLLIKKLSVYFLSIGLFIFLIFGYFFIAAPNELIVGLTATTSKIYPSWGLKINLPRQIFRFIYFMGDFPVLFVPLISMLLFCFSGQKQNNLILMTLLKNKDKANSTILLASLLLVSLGLFEIVFVAYPCYQHIIFYAPLMIIIIAWYYKPLVLLGLHSSREIRSITILLIFLAIFVSYFNGPSNLFKAILMMKKEYNYSSKIQFKMISKEIKQITNQNQKIFSFTPIFAIYAERKLLPGLEVGFVGYSPAWTDNEVKRYHVYNFQQIKNWIQSNSAAVVVITDIDKMSFPFKEGSAAGKIFWRDFYYYLQQNYKISFTRKIDDNYWGNATVYIPINK